MTVIPRARKTIVTVTIDPDLVPRMDELVKLRVYRNRSHCLEFALSKLLNNADSS